MPNERNLPREKFEELYTRTTNPRAGRIVLSDDAYAIGLLLEEVIKELRRMRP